MNKPIRFFGLRLSACFEIAVFFVVLFLIAYFFDEKYNYLDFSLNPFWIIIILISAQYGTKEGLLAAAISTLIFLSGPQLARNYLQDHFSYLFTFAKLPLLWFITAVILGELRLKQIRAFEILKAFAEESTERERQVAESYHSLKIMKEKLEMRVAGELETALMALQSFQKLDKHSPDEILKGAYDLIKTLIAPEKFSIYTLQEQKLKMILSDGWEKSDGYSSLFDDSSLIYQEIVGRKKELSIITSDPQILGTEGVLAAPIVHDDKVLGMFKVEQIPFFRLNTTTVEMLKSIGQWVGFAMARS